MQATESALLAAGGAELLSAWPRNRWSVHPTLWAAATLKRPYDQRRLCHLLRLIRNVQQHPEMLSERQWVEVVASVGRKQLTAARSQLAGSRGGQGGGGAATTPRSSVAASYFLARFEHLLVCVWRTASRCGWVQTQEWENFSR